MARMRTLKPGFFTSEGIAPALMFRARLTFAGLWTYCDDHGRGKDNVRLIKADVWPLDDDVTLGQVDLDLDALVRSGHVVRYEHGGVRYLAVQNWHYHQKPNHPTATKLPDPPVSIAVPAPGERGHCASCWTVHVGLTDTSRNDPGRRGRGVGGEKEGEDAHAPPNARCPQHVDNPHPPACGRCKEARIAREQWDRDVKEAAKMAGLAARGCRHCDTDGWRYEPGTRHPLSPPERCDHRPLRRVS